MTRPLHTVIETALNSRSSAIIEATTGARLDYPSLQRLSDGLRDRLAAMSVARGSRVGLYLHKSGDGIASMFGILKSGAAYVPVDPTAPVARNAYIHSDCDVSAVIIEASYVEAYREAFEALGKTLPPLIVLDAVGAGAGLCAALEKLNASQPTTSVPTVMSDPDELAYILYTSGSTGKPKGVMLSHRNAMAFVDWCSRVLEPTDSDTFSSHAPFHFDLSILDIFVSIKHGASLVIIGEAQGKEPLALARIATDYGISVWYSTPSVLSLMTQFGKLEDRDLSKLRLMLFAGEVFALTRLRALKALVPDARYLNLYGPTETNVCTHYELPPEIPPDRTDPFPIGQVCDHLEGLVVDTSDKPVANGAEGELCISGDNVMVGYWGRSDLIERAFLVDSDGRRWYRTGDLVVDEGGGSLRYVGRKDRMIKLRGYRVELGEIEACLHRHPSVLEAAVVVVEAPDGITVKAHLGLGNRTKLSLIDFKTFCSKQLPLYMIPDSFAFHSSLPKTSTDKIDYQSLKQLS